MKSIVAVSMFNYFDIRIKYLKKVALNRDYKFNYLCSDFDHIKKEKIKISDNAIYIKTPKYKKNISFQRIFSHLIFSYKTFMYLKRNHFDIIYVMVPPNFLLYLLGKLKIKKTNVKFIIDIYDLWPESFPIKSKVLEIPMAYWANFRDNELHKADFLVSECKLYGDYLKITRPYQVLYPTKSMDNFLLNINEINKLSFLYLGSINNIIDIDLIVSFIGSFEKVNEIEVHIIGDGEKRNELLKKLSSKNIKYHYHGVVFLESQKYKIASRCNFALNIFKESVVVGMTMKSIDYFSYGLIIINTIKSDTSNFVELYECGYNIQDGYSEVVNKISQMNTLKLGQMKINSRKVFDNHLAEKNVMESYNQLIDNIESFGSGK
jgi:hypothetical protein